MDAYEETPMLPPANRSRQYNINLDITIVQTRRQTRRCLNGLQALGRSFVSKCRRTLVNTGIFIHDHPWQVLAAAIIPFILYLWIQPDLGILFEHVWSRNDPPPLIYPHESIRLLHLKPGKGSARIEADLEVVRFVDHPTFDALSYTWGEPTWTKWITVNGKRMTIRENLWTALQNIRHPTEPRILWVDAICINQYDTEEKSTQVPLMAFIYSRANEVLVWLGHQNSPRWVQTSIPVEWRGAFAVEHAQKYWESARYWIYRLVHQEYWKRAWIVQEIGMARSIRVYFGRQSVPWPEWIKLVQYYDNRVYDPAVRHVLKLENVRRSRYQDGEAYSMSTLLDTFSDNFCSVKHDKVYAFLGMANDYESDVMPVDYALSLPDVYQDIITTQNLSVFDRPRKRIEMVYFSALIRQLFSRESSTKKKKLRYFGTLADPDTYLYNRCGDENEWVCLADKSGNTTMSLMAMDSGRSLMQWMGSFIFRPHVDREHFWNEPTPESHTPWLNDNVYSAENIQVRGILSGFIRYIGPIYSDYSAYPDVSRRWRAALPTLYANDTELKKALGQNERLGALLGAASDPTPRNIVPFKGQFAHNQSPSLFVGSDLMMGLIPPNARVGDMICQFWNSSGAAVVRRNEDGGLEIIGRAAVINLGQAMEWNRIVEREPFEDLHQTVDLNLDLAQLTRISFDTVILPGTGDPDEDKFPL